MQGIKNKKPAGGNRRLPHKNVWLATKRRKSKIAMQFKIALNSMLI